MTGTYQIKIGDKEKTLRFNNYAHSELAKSLFTEGHYITSPTQLVERLLEISKENPALLMKCIVYAGLVGHDYEVGFAKTVTQQEVGVWIADINNTDLEQVWNVFMQAMGADLKEAVEEDEDKEEEEEVIEKKS